MVKYAPQGDRRRSFWARVEPRPSGCWEWTGGTRTNGYGMFAVRKPDGAWTQTTAHRYAFVDAGGVIPAGFEVDHLCRNRACVRPDHLEAVSVAENRLRRDGRSQASGVYSTEPRPLPSLPPLPVVEKRKPAVAKRKSVTAKREPAERCKNGHLYAEVGWRSNGPGRTCKGCSDERQARRRKGGRHGTETHCPQGHPYEGDNLYLRSNGGRECRTCVLARNRAYRTKKAQARDGSTV